MTSSWASEAELQQQRTKAEAALREGWVPQGAGKARVLTNSDYAAARKVIEEGGWTGLDRVTIDAVRNGAQPGDPLPPLERKPFIAHVGDAEVIIIGEGREQRVAVVFSHDHFPGVRFGHRLPLPSQNNAGHELVWLKEEIETGALRRMMLDPPAADDAGIIWTTWAGHRT